jgi:hypothetical protein
MSDNRQRPFSIKIFVPTGDPDGLRIVEKSNWTGVGIVFNRTNYKQVVRRPEFEKTGIYVLVGVSDGGALPTVYVGEGDPVKDRLNQHYSTKDFWDWAVFFVSKDGSLNKAHVQRIECKLLELIRAAKQCRLDNGNMPQAPSLSEADTADVDSYLLDMLSIFPLLGLNVFERPQDTVVPQTLLYIQAKGIKSVGYEDAKGFVVRRGSQLVRDEVRKIQPFMSRLRADLLEQGVIVPDGQHFTFSQDHIFSSPSTAASVVLARSANGRTEWRTPDGMTLKELQERSARQIGMA